MSRTVRRYLLLSIPITMVALFLALCSGEAGTGTYFFAKALFPVPMLSTLLTGQVSGPLVIALALVQFPLLALPLGRAARRRRAKPLLLTLTALHLVAVVLCFRFLSNF